MCVNPNAANGLHELQPTTPSLLRVHEFLPALSEALLSKKGSVKTINRALAQIFGPMNEEQTWARRHELVDSSRLERIVSTPTPLVEMKPWSAQSVQAAERLMVEGGWQSVTRTAQTNEEQCTRVLNELHNACRTASQALDLDPFVFGLGGQLSLAQAIKENTSTVYGQASKNGTLTLRCDDSQTNMVLVFFHEWTHMLDHGAFYAARNPELCSPLEAVEEPLRVLHKNLIRLPASMRSTGPNPYAELEWVVREFGKKLEWSVELQNDTLERAKEVLRGSLRPLRRRALNEFIHEEILENKSRRVNVLTLVDDILTEFNSVSAGLAGFHKHLKKGFSEFYAISLQMDEGHYRVGVSPRRWYEDKRPPYFSKPTEVLARSSEGFFAHVLNTAGREDWHYPRLKEGKRVVELFGEFMKHVQKIKLSPNDGFPRVAKLRGPR